jgi:hypothetical protein
MTAQLLQHVVFALCTIAGTRKVGLESFYLQDVLLMIAAPRRGRPDRVGE